MILHHGSGPAITSCRSCGDGSGATWLLWSRRDVFLSARLGGNRRDETENKPVSRWLGSGCRADRAGSHGCSALGRLCRAHWRREHRREPRCHQRQAPGCSTPGTLHGASPILPPSTAGWAPPKTLCPDRRETPDINPALKAAQGFNDMSSSSSSSQHTACSGVCFATAECYVNH